MHVFLLSLSAPSSTSGPGAIARPLGAAPCLAPQCPVCMDRAGQTTIAAFGDFVTACHGMAAKSRAQLSWGAVKSLMKNTQEVFEQAGATFPQQRTGVPVSCARPCLTAHCAALLAPEDGLCPSPCSLPAHRERQNTGEVRTYLPRAHGNRQRVCLSHLCCWISVWRRKEKPFLLQHVPVHPCCPLARLRDGSVPPSHSACSRTAAPLLGTSHTSHSKTHSQPQDGVGSCGTHPKQGAPFSPLRYPFPPSCRGMEPALPPGHSAQSPFLLPQKTPLSHIRGLQWAQATLCLAVCSRPA